ncbi:hypothetical protein Ade02nite_32710 [Paractinoplanes deccanensis]|uniref:Cobalamin-independent methionine synthase MetE C-terminal/archaeal domain-containing protein n=1 Tax=Paractinoplanes deccanensis TaxID=113561 RepID=A0ABQ3Y3V4_9ACTN|nr:hypothetical protein [Actinoplanes deccanensis]GID74630.1 hypothetical protein Ade02nite_32710 [Actinoplanes deccanensis]
MADTYKFRIDHHGSLVRPPELLEARRRHASGSLTDAQLRAAEDEAIAAVVRDQRKLSLSVVTDGQFRRSSSADAVLTAVEGFTRTESRWVAGGPLKAVRSLVADDTAAVDALTRQIPAKATLPSAATLAVQTFDPAGPYGSPRELGEAIAAIIRDEIEALIAKGIRYLQLDGWAYTNALGGSTGSAMSLADHIAVDTLAVEIKDKPADVRIGLCPAVVAPESVSQAAAEQLFGSVPVDRWILPYDKHTEAELALLKAVPASKDVCLGIVDPFVAALEDIDAVMRRMDLAFEVRDLEDVAVSPSAGFSDVAGGSAIGVEDQRRKLIHVETVARMCWGNEL